MRPTTAQATAPPTRVTLSTLVVLGVVWGWVYSRARNVVVPVLCHGVYNAVLFGVAYVTVL